MNTFKFYSLYLQPCYQPQLLNLLHTAHLLVLLPARLPLRLLLPLPHHLLQRSRQRCAASQQRGHLPKLLLHARPAAAQLGGLRRHLLLQRLQLRPLLQVPLMADAGGQAAGDLLSLQLAPKLPDLILQVCQSGRYVTQECKQRAGAGLQCIVVGAGG